MPDAGKSQATIPEEVSLLVEEYRRTFLALEPELLAGCYDSPCFGVAATGVLSYMSPRQLMDQFRVVTAELRAAGLKTLAGEIKSVERSAPNILEVRIFWRLCGPSEATLKTFDNKYIFRRVDARWLVSAVLFYA